MIKYKQYRNLEKTLEQKYKDSRENEAVLCHDDFRDGKFTVPGYEHLKQQCDYISFSEDIEIKIPQEYEADFKDTLEYMGASELSRIKKDIRDTRIKSLVLFAIGLLWVILGVILDILEALIWTEIIVIASWVFVWGAIDKWFFDRRDLRERRFALLQILSAKIIAQD